MAYTRAFGPLPGTQLVQMGEQGGAQAEPPVVSPFSGANMAPIGTDWTCSMASPFVVAPSFASLPKDIQDMVDERFKADFVKVLDPSQQEQDKHKILAIMDEYSAKGNQSAIAFLQALVKAKPLFTPPKPLSAQVIGSDPAAASSEDASTLQQKVQAGRKRRNELANDQKRKQRAADASASEKVGLLQQIAKLQADLKSTEELHTTQQVELAEADRLLGQETLRVQALEAQLQESCRPSGAASSFAPPLATVEGLDAKQKAEAIKSILGRQQRRGSLASAPGVHPG